MKPQASLAPLEERDRVYRALLSRLTLAPDHRENLLRRGLTDEAIERLGYKSTPVVGFHALAQSLLDEGYTLFGVPGFYRDGDGRWTMAVWRRGILIPGTYLGKIQGFQIRLDNKMKKGGKFLSFSSRDELDGAMGENWCHLVGPVRERILLIEGYMKADIVNYFTGQTMLAIPGVTSLQHLEEMCIRDSNYLYQHATLEYALANIDRRYTRKEDGEGGVLECKSLTYHKAADWADGAIPIYYELQLRYYLAVLDEKHGAFSALWGNNPENDLATPHIERVQAKEDIIFEKLDRWIWSLRHDKPPTMEDVQPQLAMDALARIYGAGKKGLPTIEFPRKYEPQLRKIAALQEENAQLKGAIKKNEEAIEAHSVRIAELMKEHEHGILTTTTDKLLVDFVTSTSRRVSSEYLKQNYPSIYEEARKPSKNRKVKVTIQPL